MAEIITFSVQSGSNGNCIYVEAGSTRLLFDAGISGKRCRERMAEHGRLPQGIDGIFISHEHSDHMQAAGVYHRMFSSPIYMTERTHQATRCSLGKLTDVRYFTAGESVAINGVTVHTISTPHDAADGVVFVVEFDGKRLGIFTDLGHVFDGMIDVLGSVDAAYLESNYDEQMLANGPYPLELQRRISGSYGHVSNREAAEMIRQAAGAKHQWIALSHISEHNNCPDLAIATHEEIVGKDFPYGLSSRYGVSPLRIVS